MNYRLTDVEWELQKKSESPEERMEKGQAHIANLRAAMFKNK